jgi:hypothetical protein
MNTAKIIRLQDERRHYSDMARRAYDDGLFELAADCQESAAIVHNEIAWFMTRPV